MAFITEDRTTREDALLDSFESVNAQIASLEAERARLLADRFDMLLAEDPFGSAHHEIALRSLVAELAAASHLSTGSASAMLHRAHTLTRQFPQVWRALRDGAITSRHADAIINGASALSARSEQEMTEYQGRALEVAVSESPGRTRVMVKAIAASIAPTTVAERHRAALAHRQARTYPLDDGLGQLVLSGPEYLVQAAYDRATETAKQLIAQRPVIGPAENDDRTLDQVRADVMLELLIASELGSACGTPAEAIRATVQVTIAASTLAGEDDRMAHLDGFGPMFPEQVRPLAARAPVWTRLFLDPAGMLTITDTYSPSESMKRYLRARDQRCRFPGCQRAARRCQIDHNHDHAKGGATELRNLCCLCVNHHTLKHPDLHDRHRWSVAQLPGGVIAWTSPMGRTYIDEPPPRVMFV